MICGHKKKNRLDIITIYSMIHWGHQTSMLHKLPRELWGTSFFPWLWLWQLRSYNDDLYLQGRNPWNIQVTTHTSLPTGSFYFRTWDMFKTITLSISTGKNSGMQLLASIMQITVQTPPKKIFLTELLKWSIYTKQEVRRLHWH